MPAVALLVMRCLQPALILESPLYPCPYSLPLYSGCRYSKPALILESLVLESPLYPCPYMPLYSNAACPYTLILIPLYALILECSLPSYPYTYTLICPYTRIARPSSLALPVLCSHPSPLAHSRSLALPSSTRPFYLTRFLFIPPAPRPAPPPTPLAAGCLFLLTFLNPKP